MMDQNEHPAFPTVEPDWQKQERSPVSALALDAFDCKGTQMAPELSDLWL